MSEAPETAIQLALCGWLQTPDLGVSIAWPFTPFSPVAGVSFLDVRGILRGEPNAVGLAFGGSVLRTGVFQVDAVTPNDQGEAPGLRLAALVTARFAQGVAIIAGALKINLNHEPKIAAAVMDAPWLRFPVSIPYSVST